MFHALIRNTKFFQKPLATITFVFLFSSPQGWSHERSKHVGDFFYICNIWYQLVKQCLYQLLLRRVSASFVWSSSGISFNFNLHVLHTHRKTYEHSEEGQELRPKHDVAIININIVRQIRIKCYMCNICAIYLQYIFTENILDF